MLLTLKIDFIGCKDFSSIPSFFRIFTKKVHQDLFLGAAWEEQQWRLLPLGLGKIAVLAPFPTEVPAVLPSYMDFRWKPSEV